MSDQNSETRKYCWMAMASPFAGKLRYIECCKERCTAWKPETKRKVYRPSFPILDDMIKSTEVVEVSGGYCMALPSVKE